MNTAELMQICKIDKYINPVFEGVFPSDRLPKKDIYPAAYIVNTDGTGKPGTHWVAMYFDQDQNGDYFDSYGRAALPVFKTYMDRHCLEWQYNGKQLQTPLTSTCGQYCVFFLHQRCRGVALQKIIDMFGSDTVKNDQMVTNFINHNYQVNTKMIDISYVINQICKVLEINN